MAPNSDSNPPTIQARYTSSDDPVSRIISLGMRKIPLPITVPITIAMASPAPRTRGRPGEEPSPEPFPEPFFGACGDFSICDCEDNRKPQQQYRLGFRAYCRCEPSPM